MSCAPRFWVCFCHSSIVVSNLVIVLFMHGHNLPENHRGWICKGLTINNNPLHIFTVSSVGGCHLGSQAALPARVGDQGHLHPPQLCAPVTACPVTASHRDSDRLRPSRRRLSRRDDTGMVQEDAPVEETGVVPNDSGESGRRELRC